MISRRNCFFLILAYLPLHAIGSSGELTAAVNAALVKSAAVAEAKANAAAQELMVSAARRSFYPSLSVSASWNRGEYDNHSIYNSSNGLARPISEDVRLQLRQHLINPPASADISVAERQFHLATINIAHAEQRVIFDVAEAFFAVLEKKLIREQLEEYAGALDIHLAKTESNMAIGIGAHVDVVETKLRREEISADIEEADAALKGAYDLFMLLTGKEASSLLAPTINRKISSEIRDIDFWLKNYLLNSPRVLEAAHSLAVAKARESRVRSEFFPTLDLVAQHGRSYDERLRASDPRSIPFYSTSYGVELRVPISTGGVATARLKSAAQQATAAAYAVEQVKDELAGSVSNAHSSLNGSYRAFQASASALEVSEQALALNERGFELGLRQNSDVLNAKRSHFQIKQRSDRHYYQMFLAYIKLRHYTGLLTAGDVIAVYQGSIY